MWQKFNQIIRAGLIWSQAVYAIGNGAAPTPTPEQCKAAPFGSTQGKIQAYYDAVGPHIGGKGNTKLLDAYLQNVCVMKARPSERKPLHDYGISDAEIASSDAATLATKLLAAANYRLTLGSSGSYEIGEQVKRDFVRDGSLYIPVICSAGFCSGPHDQAYVFQTLGDCRNYLAQAHMPYSVDDGSNQSLHGYCARHAPEWQPVQ